MQLPWRDVRIGDGPPISTSLTQAEGDALTELAAGAHVLEVGSANGYSAVRMAQSAKSVLAVDPHTFVPGSLERMRENLARFDVASRVSMLLALSEDVLPSLIAMGARFGLIFIDGDHSENAVERDVVLAAELLEPDGVLACHDYGEESCGGVKAALDRMFPDAAQVIDTLWVRRL